MVQGLLKLVEARRRPQGQNTVPAFMPAPQGGINALSGAASGSPLDALFLANLIPQDYGCNVRKGYSEWCLPVPLGDGVKSIIPFSSSSGDTDDNKLFCATSDGIYEITTPEVAPVKRFNFTVKSELAGWCSWHHYATIAGQFLLIADLANGYIVYNAASDSFAAGSIAGGPVAANIDFVGVWKNRVWLVERASGSAWYLPVGQITGSVTQFNFANKFRYGGYLRGVFNFTIDGGEGLDDYLVAVSSAGDVLVYKGTDPSSASTFSMVGVYWIGDMPMGSRFASDFGGELLLLSSFGIIQMSKLLSGLPVGDEQLAVSFKVNPRLNEIMGRTLYEFGWELRAHPRDQLMFVSTPKEDALDYQQYAYNTATRAWCQFVGIPYLTGETWQNEFFIGTLDNRVFRYTGSVDNVLLADEGASANAIQWSMLGTFQSYEEPARFKRVQFLRPQFIAEAVPSFNASVRYDFNLSDLGSAPPLVGGGSSLWDVGLWDQAIWGGGFITSQPPRGARGIGRHVALVLRGQSNAPTIYVGMDVMLDAGGML